jgi:hypothetical protein
MAWNSDIRPLPYGISGFGSHSSRQVTGTKANPKIHGAFPSNAESAL